MIATNTDDWISKEVGCGHCTTALGTLLYFLQLFGPRAIFTRPFSTFEVYSSREFVEALSPLPRRLFRLGHLERNRLLLEIALNSFSLFEQRERQRGSIWWEVNSCEVFQIFRFPSVGKNLFPFRPEKFMLKISVILFHSSMLHK